MYSDETILPYGKYKLHKLKDIPANYFINLWESNGGGSDKLLKEWIANNIQRIRYEWVSLPPVVEYVPFICDKKTYPTKQDARSALAKIRLTNTTKQPIRSYECPLCSGWHLTSKEDRNYIKKG